MYIFDQLKKNDPRLRTVGLILFGGWFILLVGLWWVQVVRGREYQNNLQQQSYRTVRLPAVRGKILDRSGVILAENQAKYSISLYLEDLRPAFDSAYAAEITRTRERLRLAVQEKQQQLGRRLTKAESREYSLSTRVKTEVRRISRVLVASNAVAEVSRRLGQPLPFEQARFERHYETRRALPYPVISDVTPGQIARFQEQSADLPGVDLEMQSMRVYPYQVAAAHVLGILQRNDDSAEGEEAFFSYRLPDYRGLVGVEGGYDKELRGMAGAKSVLVNNIGYRETELVWNPTEPGKNVVLTLELRVQRAAEQALAGVNGPNTRGAAVVLDVNTGDLLALASSPTFNPNHFIQGMTREDYEKLKEFRGELNRATQENYPPGSVFKLVVGLAALEAGLSENEMYYAPPNPAEPHKACYRLGQRSVVRDTAPPGDYNFRRALKLSSNSYFINMGLRTGIQRIAEMAQRFHLGQRQGLLTRQEVSGYVPSLQRVRTGWTDGNTANVCIGQDPVLVTPLQVAVLTAAIANGGKVVRPRLVDRLESQEQKFGEPPVFFPKGEVQSEMGIRPEHLKIVHDAMLADVEDPDGTGRKAAIPGFRICAKTGTAEVENEQGHKRGKITWFTSFAPYESPRYAVVVMIEDGASGGESCAPAARKIYTELLKVEASRAGPGSVAMNDGGRP